MCFKHSGTALVTARRRRRQCLLFCQKVDQKLCHISIDWQHLPIDFTLKWFTHYRYKSNVKSDLIPQAKLNVDTTWLLWLPVLLLITHAKWVVSELRTHNGANYFFKFYLKFHKMKIYFYDKNLWKCLVKIEDTVAFWAKRPNKFMYNTSMLSAKVMPYLLRLACWIHRLYRGWNFLK